ncbi:MAG: diaminopimelate epimerase [Candidatus Izemoplasmataceae bacterium]
MIIYKYESTGNDFILTNEAISDMSQFAKEVCDRHFGIGADGLMVSTRSEIADVKMHYYNSDGSIAPMCGNGLRAFSHFVYHQGIVSKTRFSVETLAGIMEVTLQDNNLVSLNIGKPSFALSKEDIDTKIDSFQHIKLDISGKQLDLYPLMMGTFHGVVFVDSLKSLDIETLGKTIAMHPLFPKQINVNFVEIVDEHSINLITYERGAGLTLSCGTGASASALVSHKLGYTKDLITINVPGGTLEVRVKSSIYLKGPTRLIGKIEYGG